MRSKHRCVSLSLYLFIVALLHVLPNPQTISTTEGRPLPLIPRYSCDDGTTSPSTFTELSRVNGQRLHANDTNV